MTISAVTGQMHWPSVAMQRRVESPGRERGGIPNRFSARYRTVYSL